MHLYTTSLEIVPLLLIALFIDNRDTEWADTSRRRRWERVQNKTYTLLAVAAFFTSLFVASDVIHPSRLTTALVLTALGGTMTLLLLQIWRRLDRDRSERGTDGAL